MTETETPTPTLTYNATKNRLKDINDDIERLDAKADKSETRTLGEEDQKFWDDLMDEARTLGAHKARLEREDQKLELRRLGVGGRAPLGGVRGSDEMDADPLGEPDSVAERRFKSPWDTSQIRMNAPFEERSQELRARALSAIEQMQGTTDARRQTATRMVEDFEDEASSISRLVLATSSPEYTRAFAKLAKSWGQATNLTEAERVALANANNEARAMSLTTTAGGYLVPFQLDPTVINTSAGSRNDIRQAARQVISTTNVWHGVSAGETSFSWDAEEAASSDDTSTFAQPTVTCFKGVGNIPISEEALQDEGNVAGEVGKLLAAGKDTLEAVAFATGGGTTAPRGLVTAAVADTTPITSTTTDTFAIGDVYKLQGALAARYRANGSFLANNLVYNLIRQFDTAGGAGMWERIGLDRPAMLLGKDAYEAEGMDGTVTALADNYVLIFGDLSNYVIADRLGLTVQFIPNLFDQATGLPNGTSGWRATFRTGANLVNPTAVKILNVT